MGMAPIKDEVRKVPPAVMETEMEMASINDACIKSTHVSD